MIAKLLRALLGSLGVILMSLNVIFWVIPIFIMSFVKLLIPISKVRLGISAFLNWCAERWILVNSTLAHYHSDISIRWPDNIELSRKEWYLVIANHQSWLDIHVLQSMFNRKIPFLKFFLKQQLIYVPLMGLAWWALDFPFMQRHSKAYLKKHPEKKGKDLETTKQACEKFKHIPISVMNFAEGTRFTPAKAVKQQSPYKHLLKPRSGGIGTVLEILGTQMHRVLDVTLYYPGGVPTLFDYLSGKVKSIEVVVREYEVTPELVGDMTDRDNRTRVQTWLNGIWQNKDETLENLAKEFTQTDQKNTRDKDKLL